MSQNEQVIWSCCQYYKCWHTNSDGTQQRHYTHDDEICNGTMVPYVPLSEHNRLKEKLKEYELFDFFIGLELSNLMAEYLTEDKANLMIDKITAKRKEFKLQEEA